MPKDNELIKLLKILRDNRLTQEFSENKYGTYKGTYDNNYLSAILNERRNGSVWFNRAIIQDINSFLTHIQGKK